MRSGESVSFDELCLHILLSSNIGLELDRQTVLPNSSEALCENQQAALAALDFERKA
jgi:hypothetical protein